MTVRRLLCVLGAILLVGCTGAKTPVARSVNTTQPPPKVVEKKAPEVVGAKPASEDADAAEITSEVAKKESESVESARPAPANETESAPPSEPAPPPHVERFLLLAQGGPILVEAMLTMDGRPLREAMTHLVDAVLKDADTNGDGRPTWDEVLHSPEFRSGRYGNVEANSETEGARMVQLYDVNKNGVVDRGEVPRFLTRNAGGSRPFSLAGSNEYRGYNQFDSPTLRLLDQDGDGRLSGEEIDNVAIRLRSRDADTDDIILPSDLTFASLEATPGRMANRRRAAPDAAYPIDSQTQWDVLLYSLSELYAYGGDLEATSFPQRPGLFEKLDTGGDGTLNRDELQRLAEIEPHIKLEVHFGAAAAQEDVKKEEASEEENPYSRSSATPKLRLAGLGDELQVDPSSISESDVRISLELPDTEVVFFANDAAGANYRAQAQAQIATYDANSDGYLEEGELPNGLPGIAMSFEALDGNDDDKLYLDELTEYLRQRAGAALSQIRARAADQADALFAALDEDNDGRIETRELERAAQRLRSLDANQDGIVTSNEFPGAMAVGFVRGDPQQGDALYVMPVAPNAADEDAPAWFRQMDFNGDGEIAAREFLGDPDQFAALDADGDGYLNAQEAIPK